MESSETLKPCQVKLGDLTFKSTSRECLKSLLFPETIVLSILYNKELTVPDAASSVQLEQKVNAKVVNPFNAVALRVKEKNQAEKAGTEMGAPTPSGKATCG
mmetsp:Transcript_33861/g.71035  ORF Transcript_33861/g.71035 Transcript_33861/m.71035 type:complete len:102 (-) Transcript_33861:292-597(-)